jgi:predicted dehydrogenase
VIRVGVIGTGLMGGERLTALQSLRAQGRDVEIVGLLDPYNLAAPAIAASAGTTLAESPDHLLRLQPDWVFVATPHDVAVELVERLLYSGVRLLVEKPLGRSAAEARRLVSLARAPDQLWVGLNYRFFEGIALLLQDVRNGHFGPIVSVTMTMGHGGSPGMEAGWKIDPRRAGGGALLDPGIHLLDLAWLLEGGELSPVGGTSWVGFWNTGVEEECHLFLRGRTIPTFNVQVSIVRWRSIFRLEVHGESAYGCVEGRNRSYGQQTYRRGVRWGWSSGGRQVDSEQQVLATPGYDVFEKEISALLFPEEPSLSSPCSGREAVEVMELLDECRTTLSLPSSPAGSVC